MTQRICILKFLTSSHQLWGRRQRKLKALGCCLSQRFMPTFKLESSPANIVCMSICIHVLWHHCGFVAIILQEKVHVTQGEKISNELRCSPLHEHIVSAENMLITALSVLPCLQFLDIPGTELLCFVGNNSYVIYNCIIPGGQYQMTLVGRRGESCLRLSPMSRVFFH